MACLVACFDEQCGEKTTIDDTFDREPPSAGARMSPAGRRERLPGEPMPPETPKRKSTGGSLGPEAFLDQSAAFDGVYDEFTGARPRA